MMRIGMLAVVVGAMGIGCGGGGHSDPLAGTWGLEVNACAVGFTFSAPSRYEYDLICPTTSGLSGLESEVGTYNSTPTRLTFTVEKATCAGSVKSYYLDYSLPSIDRLSVVYADGVEVLQRVMPTGTGVGTFGCWSMGTFTPMPLAALP